MLYSVFILETVSQYFDALQLYNKRNDSASVNVLNLTTQKLEMQPILSLDILQKYWYYSIISISTIKYDSLDKTIVCLFIENFAVLFEVHDSIYSVTMQKLLKRIGCILHRNYSLFENVLFQTIIRYLFYFNCIICEFTQIPSLLKPKRSLESVKVLCKFYSPFSTTLYHNRFAFLIKPELFSISHN